MEFRKPFKATFVQAPVRLTGLILSFIFFVAGCDQAKLASTKTTFPVVRNITDKEGRSIQAEIIGRNVNAIVINKLPGQTRHIIPIDRLSKEDRNFAESLPIQSVLKNETTSRLDKISDTELEKVNEEIDKIYKELEVSYDSPMKMRSLRSKLSRLQKKVFELEQKINDRD